MLTAAYAAAAMPPPVLAGTILAVLGGTMLAVLGGLISGVLGALGPLELPPVLGVVVPDRKSGSSIASISTPFLMVLIA